MSNTAIEINMAFPDGSAHSFVVDGCLANLAVPKYARIKNKMSPGMFMEPIVRNLIASVISYCHDECKKDSFLDEVEESINKEIQLHKDRRKYGARRWER